MKKIKIDNKKNMLALVDVEIINQEQVLQSLFILKWTIKNKLKNK
jgi:hypothetical protein